MTVDVLFPFYGDVELMKQAVHSVLRQSHRDFRLIVIDDGYPDASIPGWFAALGDDRVSYERNATNLGANGNYRKALTRVTNELVVVMGADDVMLPNYLQWLVDRAGEHPEVQIFQPGVVVIDEHGSGVNGLVDAVKSVYRPRGSGVRVLTGEALAVSLLRGDWLYFPSVGWRAETITSIGFREGYDVVQDLALALDVAMHGGSLLVDSQLAFMYRRHSSSDSSVRALSGTRFDEERRFFENMAAEMAERGWNHAARVARLHLSSRFHAATLLPGALRHGNREGLRNLGRHLVK
ncbi:glycosyltransferase family 2 protein [Propionibacterium freudenreichii]|uniref:glycosyltransferase family 2 protein n=1 Tax=Propionibacterium freudenreichii TaxID=1744 RepID=UPI00049FC1BF|nr:glycosyltransferase family 2 protein [Propionibacterium freudenreichii]AJQ89794.1 Alpha-1,6-rhamnosyltransferase MigA [Propionibacterium freudenreichii subsp. freudenreichii]AWY94818.1 Alpha-1,3-rhamnosyltransferase WapR [Propionibacterium freudenreichii]AWY94848.1 Alpha-1,3-rhamnosyltransferase WapR [Propionibacterium freudenreichii]MCT2977664.1 glycosyltransferase family 2 protein [Propionibacterium freudenreichii]MCT2981520.1 glycosyltransferase family 2 protein [Propionibacterium freude